MNYCGIEIELSLLAGMADALREHSKELPISEIENEFQTIKQQFAVVMNSPGLATLNPSLVKQEIRDIACALTEASYIIKKRTDKKLKAIRTIRVICKTIDTWVEKILGFRVLEPVLDILTDSESTTLFGESLELPYIREKKFLNSPNEVHKYPSSPPYVQVSRPFTPPREQHKLPSPPPPVPKKYRHEVISRNSISRPPDVLEHYRVEHVGRRKK